MIVRDRGQRSADQLKENDMLDNPKEFQLMLRLLRRALPNIQDQVIKPAKLTISDNTSLFAWLGLACNTYLVYLNLYITFISEVLKSLMLNRTYNPSDVAELLLSVM